MAVYLLDTNVLLRIADLGDRDNALATGAVSNLIASGQQPVLTSQVLVEMWSVATRPLLNNGLGWDTRRISDAQGRLLHDFQLLTESGEIFPQWQALVQMHRVNGKQVHDARLAAVVLAAGHRHILTFNPTDFSRFAGLNAVHPKDVTAQVF